jgi:hypothetical protein
MPMIRQLKTRAQFFSRISPTPVKMRILLASCA